MTYLCQVVMTKTLTGYDVLVYLNVLLPRHLKVIFALKIVIFERMTLNDSCHKHA